MPEVVALLLHSGHTRLTKEQAVLPESITYEFGLTS
jgi:hypothetical protein